MNDIHADGWIDFQMHGWLDGCLGEYMKLTNRWMNSWTDG